MDFQLAARQVVLVICGPRQRLKIVHKLQNFRNNLYC
jgi:hypothetical protein